MICGNCQRETHHTQVRIEANGDRIETCNYCSSVGNVTVPDVYWPGHAYTSENITDRMGVPIEMTSRRHKAQIMKEKGYSEIGDRYHGTTRGNQNYFK